MIRLFLFLSVASFCLAHHGIAHAQSIVIRDSDFYAGASQSAAVNGSANVSASVPGGAPMRIVPNVIGRPDATLAGSHQGIPAGLLIPHSAEATAPAVTTMVVAGDTGSSVSAQ
jgi:hypothetical protein